MKIDKKLWLMITGIATMFFWAMVLCLVSAIYAPLDISRGVYIGNNLIGSISRYWDPILLGVLVAFASFAWQHQPPSFSWKKGGKFGESKRVSDEISNGFVVNCVLFAILLIYKSYSDGYVPKILSLYLIMLLTPYGWRGVIVASALITFCFWSIYGLLFAGAFFVATWIGKWFIWWIVNIVFFGCKDTVMKLSELKGKLPPDHSREGTDVPEQLRFQ